MEALKQAAKPFRRRLKRERATYSPDTQRKAQSLENFIGTIEHSKGRVLSAASFRADALAAIDEFAAALRA